MMATCDGHASSAGAIIDWSRNVFGFRNGSEWLPAIAKRRCKNLKLPKNYLKERLE